MVGDIIDLQGISRISFVCHVAVSQRSQNWDIGDLKVRRVYFTKKKLKQLVVMVRNQVVLKDPNIMLHVDGTKKNCVKLNNMYESN